MAKFELDEETKARLIGVLPFNKNARYAFIPDECKKLLPEKMWPRFEIRPFNKVERDLVGDSEKLYKHTMDAISGWSNLIDVSSGETIEFVKQDDYSEILPTYIINAILRKLLEISGLTDIEKLSLKFSPLSTQEKSGSDAPSAPTK
jgi:hypothetical protein